MSRKWNWGIIGCGRIAAKFSEDLKTLDQAHLYAAASRNLEKAKEFSAKHGFEKGYGSYEEMVNDPNLDVVYVASPHSHHMEHTLLCIENGKAVLCEKAFALNLEQVDKMISASKEKGIFLMEAFWTRFQPAFLELQKLLADKVLGETKMMRSDFAFNAPYEPEKRLYNPALGGGSLLDIGIYPVFSALQTFGRPDQLRTVATFSPTGSEESIAILFKYADGRIASLQSSFAVSTHTLSEFWCEKGHIRLVRDDIGKTFLEIWEKGEAPKILDYTYEGVLGYHQEAIHVMECLDKKLTESPLLPLSFSYTQMETLDRIRKDAGIKFPFEAESKHISL